jgi:uncharacterized protein YunC (DUF1805 family)
MKYILPRTPLMAVNGQKSLTDCSQVAMRLQQEVVKWALLSPIKSS